jgi:hypothetical protein
MSIKDLNTKNVILLSLVGNSIEVTLQHPLNTLKNHKQSKHCKFQYNFANLYRGYFFNFYSLNIVSLFQYYGYNYLYKKTKNDMMSSLGTGLLSGLIASPAEYYIINKKHTETLLECVQRKKITKIYKYGFFSCLMREGIYTASLFTITPMLEKKLKEKEIKFGCIISPILSGSIASFFSHPFDTRKTIQQKNNNNKLKLKCDYKGFGYRTSRMISTFFILNEVNKFFMKNIF